MRRIAVILTLAVITGWAAKAVGEEDTEGRIWPYQLHYEDAPDRRGRANVNIWIPPGVERIRAMLIIVENTDSKHFGEHAATRDVLRRHEAAVVYLRVPAVEGDLQQATRQDDRPRILDVLDFAAERTGIEEFRHAPWVTFGKSSRGKFPFTMAWAYPERTIAGITYHGETPTWPPEDWARLDGESILYVAVNGQTEWGGTWNRHVRPALLNYRSQKGWLAHQVVVRGVDHGNYPDTHGSPGWGKEFPDQVTCIDVWDYLAVFLDKALEARLPAEGYPTEGPVKLRQLDEADGWLVDKFGAERMLDLRPYRLVESDGLYVVDPAGDEHQGGYAAIDPAEGFEPPEGVPVVPLEIGHGPTAWLVSEPINDAVEDDPMVEYGELPSLRPKPGKEIVIDGHTTAFSPLGEGYVDNRGAILLTGRLQKQDELTLLAYTVLEVNESRHVKLQAPYTQNGRVQVFLNGKPVKHEQVLELSEGRYPMLVAMRLRTTWQKLSVSFAEAGERDIERGKQLQTERDRLAADSDASGASAASLEQRQMPILQKASEVDETDRSDSFWIIDRELAEHWRKLHEPPDDAEDD